MTSMREKIEKIKSIIQEIKKDCDSLEEKRELSERGRGQLDLAKRIEEILN